MGGVFFVIIIRIRVEIKMKTTLYDKNGNVLFAVESSKPTDSNSQKTDIPEMCQSIVNELVKVLPAKWEKVRLYSQITKSSYEFFYQVYVDKKWIQCYQPDIYEKYGISEAEISNVFDKLYEIMLPDQRSKNWYVATLSLDKSGKVKLDYEYKDYSETSLKYKKMWKEKFLK